MAIQRTGSGSGLVDTTKSMIIVDPNAFPVNLGHTASEDYPEGSFRLIAYDGKNILPTALGYKTFFSENTLFDSLPLPSAFCQHIIVFQTASFSNLIVCLCEEGIFWCNATADQATGWQWVAETGHNNAAETKVRYLWTWAMVANKLCLYSQGQPNYFVFADIGTTRNQVANAGLIKDSTVLAIYESPALGFGINKIKPTFLNMAGQMGLFRAGARLGFWDSDNSVSWSSATYIQDFTPDVTTFAGSTKFADVTGTITKVVGQGQGFVIYATSSVTRCIPLSASPEKWQGAAILSETGVVFDTQIAAAQPDETHYAITSSGLAKITGGQVEFVETEVSDYIQENSEVYALKVLDGRYLFLHSSDDLVPSRSTVEVVKVTDADGDQYNFPPTIEGGDTPGEEPIPEPTPVFAVYFEDDTWSVGEGTNPPFWSFSGNTAAWERSQDYVTQGLWGIKRVPGNNASFFGYQMNDFIPVGQGNRPWLMRLDYKVVLLEVADQLINPNSGPFLTGPGTFTGTYEFEWTPDSGSPGLVLVGPGFSSEGLAEAYLDNLRVIDPRLLPGPPEADWAFRMDFEDDNWKTPEVDYPGSAFYGNPSEWVRTQSFVTHGAWGLAGVTGAGPSNINLIYSFGDAIPEEDKTEEHTVQVDYRVTLTPGDMLININSGPVLSDPGVFEATYVTTLIPLNVTGQFGLVLQGPGVADGLASFAIDNLRIIKTIDLPVDPGEPEPGSPDPRIPWPQYIQGQATGQLDTLQRLFEDFTSEDGVNPSNVQEGRTLLPCYNGHEFASSWDEGVTLVPYRTGIRDIQSITIPGLFYALQPLTIRFNDGLTTSDQGPSFKMGIDGKRFIDIAGTEWVNILTESMVKITDFAAIYDGITTARVLGTEGTSDYDPAKPSIVPASFSPPNDWRLDGTQRWPWSPLDYNQEAVTYSKSIGDLLAPASLKMLVNQCSTRLMVDLQDYTMKAVPDLAEKDNINLYIKHFGFCSDYYWYSDPGLLPTGYAFLNKPWTSGIPTLSIAVNMAHVTDAMVVEYNLWRLAGSGGHTRNLMLLGLEWNPTFEYFSDDDRTQLLNYNVGGASEFQNRGTYNSWQRWNHNVRAENYTVLPPVGPPIQGQNYTQFRVSPAFLLDRYPEFVAVHGMSVEAFKARLYSIPPEPRPATEPAISIMIHHVKMRLFGKNQWAKIFQPEDQYPNAMGFICGLGLNWTDAGYDVRPDLGIDSPEGGNWVVGPGTGEGARYWNNVVRPYLYKEISDRSRIAGHGSAIMLENSWTVTVTATENSAPSERSAFDAEVSGFGYYPTGGFSFRKTHVRNSGTSCPIPTGKPIFLEGPGNELGLKPDPFVPTPGQVILAPLNPTPSWPYPDPVPIPDAFALFRKGTPSPFYPLYKGAVFLDLLYQKWGRYSNEHIVTFDMLPVNRVDGSVVPQKDFGVRAGALRADRRLSYFTGEGNTSAITYGRLGFYRLGVTTLTNLVVRFAEPATCNIVVEVSFDGEEILPEFSVGVSVVARKQVVIPFTLKGKWFNIRIEGQFNLTGLSYQGEARGRR